MSLVVRCFSGPVDIIGDIHGEAAALEGLLARLGYRGQGEHPDGRRLIFVGDLLDRGPDSPAVVARVQSLIEAGRAQCVLGNHELNILLGKSSKEGNDWFFYERDKYEGEKAMRQVALGSPEEQAAILRFLSTLPLALEREDLRVVHACWDAEAIARAREASDVRRFYRQEERLVEARLAAEGLHALAPEPSLRVRSADPAPWRPDIGRRCVIKQENAAKLMTSGPEALVEAGRQFFVGGQWRFAQRARWWESYRGPAVAVGHYWRNAFAPGSLLDYGAGSDPLAAVAPDLESARVAPGSPVRILDFGVGKGYAARSGLAPAGLRPALAALRWPERALVLIELVD